jgi:hypothetical protein
MKLKHFILSNTRPIAFVVLGAVIGALLGQPQAGVLIPIGIIALVHLFL